MGGTRPLVIGDRLDTDIEGAVTMGWDSLLVLTGVTGLEELVRAGREERPTYVAPDLAALAEPQPAPEVTDDGVGLGGWTAVADDGELSVTGEGSAGRLVARRRRRGMDPSRRDRAACRDRRAHTSPVAWRP